MNEDYEIVEENGEKVIVLKGELARFTDFILESAELRKRAKRILEKYGDLVSTSEKRILKLLVA